MTDWISVDDRLPMPRDGDFLRTKVYVTAKTAGGTVKECGFHLAAQTWDDSDYAPMMNITHWMPLKKRTK
jgi:hypothetical protein